jgi:Fibronectin type III-like domain
MACHKGWSIETLRSSVIVVTWAQARSLRQRDLEPGQLKAFQIVRPEPGEISEVDMEIPLDDLAMYDDQYGSRVVRPGGTKSDLASPRRTSD